MSNRFFWRLFLNLIAELGGNGEAGAGGLDMKNSSAVRSDWLVAARVLSSPLLSSSAISNE